ncbi:MAG: PEP-CTERM sorting domain-containing protein [Steroidobacteraceae bacterium]
MNLTALGNGTTYGGVYVDPYTISINGVSATLLSCDDFSTEIAVGQTWTANTENAAAVDGAVKFSSGPFSAGGSEQTTYSAAAWIATQLVTPAITNNANTQIDYSLALWELFNPTLSGGPAFSGSLNGPDAGVPSVFTLAFNAVAGGYTGSNVTVYTPNPLGASQEFLEVSAVPVPASLPLLLSGLMGLGAVLRRRRTSAS